MFQLKVRAFFKGFHSLGEQTLNANLQPSANEWNYFIWVAIFRGTKLSAEKFIYAELVSPRVWASNPGQLGSSRRETGNSRDTQRNRPPWAARFSPVALAGDGIGWVTPSCLLLEKRRLATPFNVPGTQTTQYSTITEPASLFLYLKAEISHLSFLYCFPQPPKIRRQISNLPSQALGVAP